MVSIKDKVIKITRGDSCIIEITIYEADGETIYHPTAGDTIIFTVKPDINNDYYVIRKEFENETLIINKSDTINLNFGTYFYDVRLENNSNYDTILESGSFIIEGGTANARS